MDNPETPETDVGSKQEFSVSDISKLTLEEGKVTIEMKDESEENPEMSEGEGEDPLAALQGLTGYPKPIAQDSINVVLDKDKFQIDEETGQLLVTDVAIGNEMVQMYGDTARYKPADELEAMTPFLDGKPICDGHPKGGIVTERKQVQGCMINPRFVDGQPFVDLEFRKGELQDKVVAGDVDNVSIGFHCELDATPGEFKGTPYVEVQREIYVDHLAIVKDGRCSLADGCGISEKSDKIIKKKEKKTEGDEIVNDEARKKLISTMLKLTDSVSEEELQKKTTTTLVDMMSAVNDARRKELDAKELEIQKKEKENDEGDYEGQIDDRYEKAEKDRKSRGD